MRNGWTETTLGKILSIQSGFAFSTNDWTADGYPVIKINNVRDGKVSTDSCSYISDPIPQGAEKFLLKRGDLLITLTGEIGATGIVDQAIPIYLNQRVGKVTIRDKSKASLPFIAALLNLPEVRREMWSLGKGNAQLNISPNSIQEIVVKLPPLEEQKRIVDVVSSVDAYIDALQQQADTARTARNAVLHELLSAGGDDWTETTLGAHIKIVMGQAPPGKDCNKEGVGVPFVKAGEFTDGFPVIREWTTNPLRYSKLGDTLICVVGATCGKLSKGIDCAIGRSVAALQPLENLDAGFLWNFMARKVQEMRDGSRGSAQGVITKDDLADLPLNLPPLAEQKRIAEIVSSMDEVIQSTEQAVVDAKNLRSGLLSDLLSGEHEIPASYDVFVGAA